MNCIYCSKGVWGRDGCTVPSLGPAHALCHQTFLAMKRTFGSLDITALDDDELRELGELVLAEKNARSRQHQDDIELF